MDTKLEFLFARRSVRRYQTRHVEDSTVRDLLEAAMAAPSACGKDPWEFVVVRERAALAEIATGLPNGKMLADAAVGLVVCGDLNRAHGGELSYMLQDCSAAIENILLAATALGLGACWLGVHPREERIAHLTRVLALPDQVLPISAIAVGWPAERPASRTRYNPGFVHSESW